MKAMLRTFLKEDYLKWDEHVHEFAYTINNFSPESLNQESSKMFSAFLNFRRNL